MAKKFISQFPAEEIDARLAAVSEKVGYTFFNSSDGNTLYSFASIESYEQWLDEGADSNSALIIDKTPFSFEGTMRRMVVTPVDGEQAPSFTTNKKSAVLRFTCQSQEKGITDPDWKDVSEGAKVKVEVDKGYTGVWKTIKESNLREGQTFEIDVFNDISIGTNKVRVTAIGESTEVKGTLIYTVTLTSMYMTPASDVNWHNALVEGNKYTFGGFYIGGQVSKVVKCKFTHPDNTTTIYETPIGVSIYVTTPYFFSLDFSDQFPTDKDGLASSGTYKVEVWTESGTAKTDVLTYHLMLVTKEEVGSAKLTCVNDIKTVKNGMSSELFQYAVYNAANALADVNITVAFEGVDFYSNLFEAVETSTKKSFTLAIDQSSDNKTFELDAHVAVDGGGGMFARIPVDNSANFPAVSDYDFFFNAANRNNNEGNKNFYDEKKKKYYTAVWDNISWVDGIDGYTTQKSTDTKALIIPARCSGNIAFDPLGLLSNGATIEIQYKVMNAADRNEEIITIAGDNGIGIHITPSKVSLAYSGMGDENLRSYNVNDNEVIHLVITLVNNYKGIANLAQIYVNGVKKNSFEISSFDVFSDNNRTLKIGSQSADLHLYKMRVYTRGFTWDGAFQNYVNTQLVFENKGLIDHDTRKLIDEQYNITYQGCVDNHKNVMVIEMTDGNPIPGKSPLGVEEGKCNVLFKVHNPIDSELDDDFQYFFNVDSPTDVWQMGVKIEGQGTTAMTYGRWNFRWKKLIGTDGKTERRMTAKKNVASSMQSHKMGATRLYNDVLMSLIASGKVDGTDVAKRVAIYQYPVFGFQKSKNDEGEDVYAFIGLYTVGPDKGDEKTFGFSGDDLVHLEGADHNPKSVGFDYPSSELAAFVNADGDDMFGAVEGDTRGGAWEIGKAGEAETTEAINDVVLQEFVPAYDVAEKNSPYVLGLTEEEFESLRANPSLRNSKEIPEGSEYAGAKWSQFEYYQHGDFELYYCNVSGNTSLVSRGVNLAEDLGLNKAELTAMSVEEAQTTIRNARRARFKEQAGNYWHIGDSIYHYTFMLFLGATDNFKKNTYPYKFRKLSEGGKWRWRQDDLDTILDINNRGAAVKKYSILVGDREGGEIVYVGDNSSFWTLIRECYVEEVRQMGKDILSAIARLNNPNLESPTVLNVLDYFKNYFWGYAQDYFGIAGYNEDAEWTYEDIWGAEKTTEIQSADPLMQSQGSHYEAEYQWVYLRLIFFASMVGYGEFTDYVKNDLGLISLRMGQGFTFNLTPAIDMSPVLIVGQNTNVNNKYERTQAGNSVGLYSGSMTDADTEAYIPAAHFLSSIGDISELQGGNSSKSLGFSARMLREIRMGKPEPSANITNIETITLTDCPSLETIYAQNASNLKGVIDMTTSPRLSSVDFRGTQITEAKLMSGAKIETLRLPETITKLGLVNLPKLNEGFELEGIGYLSNLRLENNKHINGFDFLRKAFKDAQSLKFIRIVGFEDTGTSEDITMLSELATATSGAYYKYNGVDANGNGLGNETPEEGKSRQHQPVITGKLTLTTPAYKSELEKVEELYNKETLNIESDQYYIEFEDPEVKRIILENEIGDGYGVMQRGTDYVDADEVVNQLKGIFQGNTVIESFDELRLFTNADTQTAFKDCTALKSARVASNTRIENGTFWGCTNLEKVRDDDKWATLNSAGARAFEGCSKLNLDLTGAILTTLGTAAFKGCKNVVGSVELDIAITSNIEMFDSTGIEKISSSKLTQISGMAAYCENLIELDFPLLRSIGYNAFSDCVNLRKVNIPSVESVGMYAFNNCAKWIGSVTFNKLVTVEYKSFYGCGINNLNAPKLETLGNQSFSACQNLKTVSAESAKKVGDYAFELCPELTEVSMPNVEELGYASFRNSAKLSSFDGFDKVKTMTDKCFYGCAALVGDITVYELTEMGAENFAGTSISSFNAPKAITIGNNNFQQLTTFVSFNAPSLETLGTYCFSGCSVETINIGNVRSIGKWCFYQCSKLTGDIILPNLEEIGEVAFYQTLITSFVALNSNLKSIPANVFNGCINLHTIEFGDGVTNIDATAFNNCSKLTSLIIHSVTPPALNGSITAANVIVYVPENSVSAYKTATNWTRIEDRIQAIQN